MSVQLLTQQGITVKFGRKRPQLEIPCLRLANYVNWAALPAPPDRVDYSPAALKSLNDVYLNDQLGICVVSGGCHVRGVTSGNAGSLVTFSKQQLIQQYSAIGGYVPGREDTDNGCEMQTAMNYWTRTGFPDGVKLLGWLAVDADNVTLCKQAIWLFENLFQALELPDAWTHPFPNKSGFLWDYAGRGNPSFGHAISAVAYTPTGPGISTWGMLGTMTWKALGEYCDVRNHGELYVLLSADMIGKGQQKSPAGLDWQQLVSDFNAMGGNVAPPAPAPAPPTPPGPQPNPPPVNQGPTFVQVQAAIHQGLQQAQNALTRQWQQAGAQILNLAASKVDANVKKLFN